MAFTTISLSRRRIPLEQAQYRNLLSFFRVVRGKVTRVNDDCVYLTLVAPHSPSLSVG